MKSRTTKLHFAKDDTGKPICGTKSAMTTGWSQITCTACAKILLAYPERTGADHASVQMFLSPLLSHTDTFSPGSPRDDDPPHAS